MTRGMMIRRRGIARTPSGRSIRGRGRSRAVLALLALVGTTTVVGVASVGIGNAAPVTATMQAQNLTKPGGGVWLPGPVGSPGHYWVPDAVFGTCQVVAQATTPPFTTTKCNGTAKAATQAVYDAARNKLYVADGSSSSISVVRFDYTASNESISNPVAMAVPNPTAVGGGSGGGRPSSVALSPDGTKLYVGYTKSGDIMVVNNPATATQTPAVQRAGSTSDGRGTQGFAMVKHTDATGQHDDLYVAEIGGAGLSSITDIDGTGGRPACGSGATPCGASVVLNSSGAVVSFFPGGLAFDGTLLYVGDAPRNTPGSVIAFNPVTKAQSTYSTDVSPAYTSTSDGIQRTQYVNIRGLGLGINGDLLIGDDPAAFALIATNAQGHLWKVSGSALQPTITALDKSSGPTAGGDVVTITGTNLLHAVAGPSTVSFGTVAATSVSCAPDGLSCIATSPAVSGAGTVDVRVTSGDSQTSAATAVDRYTYQAPAVVTPVTPPTNPVPAVTGVSPAVGVASGGTSVTITGTALTAAGAQPAVSFGAVAVPAANISCASTTQCAVTSPPGADGSVADVQVTTADGTSATVAGDKFTYRMPVGTLFSYGITAPKGGLTWVPDLTSAKGHYWVSDHSNGLCRLDVATGVPASSRLHAVNWDACDPGFTIGSPGQSAYDPRANADGSHWLYVPDNAVKSPGVWRLTFDPTTATISQPVAMAPGLMDNLKTNSLALDVSHDALYVGDLTDGFIRRINGIGGDPRLQTVDRVAMTQAQNTLPTTVGRGINGTMGMMGTRVFLPENNAATFFDTAAPCAAVGTATPCATTTLNFLPTPAPIFVSGVATDATHNSVYISSSPGGATATIYRFNVATITAANPGGTPGATYVTSGNVPAAGSPEATVQCSISCTRTKDVTFIAATTGFFFAQGLYVDPTSSALYITEDSTAGARGGRGHAWEVPFTP